MKAFSFQFSIVYPACLYLRSLNKLMCFPASIKWPQIHTDHFLVKKKKEMFPVFASRYSSYIDPAVKPSKFLKYYCIIILLPISQNILAATMLSHTLSFKLKRLGGWKNMQNASNILFVLLTLALACRTRGQVVGLQVLPDKEACQCLHGVNY